MCVPLLVIIHVQNVEEAVMFLHLMLDMHVTIHVALSLFYVYSSKCTKMPSLKCVCCGLKSRGKIIIYFNVIGVFANDRAIPIGMFFSSLLLL